MDLFGMYGSRSDVEPEDAAERAGPEEVPAIATDARTVAMPSPPKVVRAEPVRDVVAPTQGGPPDGRFDGQLVRPYARTAGRTRSEVPLELETMLTLAVGEVPAGLPAEHHAICQLCHHPVSVAEVASHRALPTGAARVVISDLIGLGLLHPVTATSDPDGPTVDLMRRVLTGLHRL